MKGGESTCEKFAKNANSKAKLYAFSNENLKTNFYRKHFTINSHTISGEGVAFTHKCNAMCTNHHENKAVWDRIALHCIAVLIYLIHKSF